jgi:3-carboxy-cis,cis-muconate cycloisomerase
MPEVSSRLDRKLIEQLTEPANYLGAAPQMVDRVLASSAAIGSPSKSAESA